MAKPDKKNAEHPVRVSDETHRALVRLQLQAVERGESRPTLDAVIAKLLKK